MRTLHRESVWLFLGLTLLVTWLFWLPFAGNENTMAGPGALVILLGGFVPSIMGVVFVYRTGDRDTRRRFWRRVFSVKQIGRLGWAVIIGYPALLYGGSIVLFRLFTGTVPSSAILMEVLGSPGLFLAFIVIGLLAGPISEELGWRGYALDKLLARYGTVAASMILGLVWWAWHIPLLFIPDVGGTGFFTIDNLTFLISGLSMSLVLTLLYLRTGRSILAAILLHFTTNITSQLISDDLGMAWTLSVLTISLLLVVAAILTQRATQMDGNRLETAARLLMIR